MIVDSAPAFDVREYLRLEMMPHFLCPGCGHGIALRALLWAIHELGIDKDKLAVVSGIGCAGRLSAYIDANTANVTHGRPLAYATVLALEQPDRHVVVITGDGDCLAIGATSVTCLPAQPEITCACSITEVYGTRGAGVPTTDRLPRQTPLGLDQLHLRTCAAAVRGPAVRHVAEGTHRAGLDSARPPVLDRKTSGAGDWASAG